MAKKIILGVLFLGLVGALVVGAVNRTAAKSADVDGAAQHGAGWATVQEDGAVLAANVQGRGGQGGGRNSVAKQAQTADRTQGGQGYQSNGADTGDRQGAGPIAETEDHEWVTLTGVVTSVDDTQMTVQTASGEIVIADRPWSFALEAGFTAQVGDQVTLDGFYEGETFEAGRLTNGQQVTLIREDSGRPLWAGGGRGRSRTW